MRQTTRQDFATSVRPILFNTGMDEFQYATHGGSAFVVGYEGRPYAITCRHVFKDFDEGQLTIFGAVSPIKGDKPARVKTVCYPTSPKASAVDTDVTDFCVIEFEDTVTTDFFDGSAYPFDKQNICSSAAWDRLVIFGAVKEKTVIDPPNIQVAFCRLEASDNGPSADPFMRRGSAQYANLGFSSPAGISGAPTFNITRYGLCGMVCRATLHNGRFDFMYADAFDLFHFVEGVSRRASNIFYTRQPST
jgi:hypothetical protein